MYLRVNFHLIFIGLGVIFAGFCLFSPVFSPQMPRGAVLQRYLVFVVIIYVIPIVLFISDLLLLYSHQHLRYPFFGLKGFHRVNLKSKIEIIENVV